MDPSCQPHSPPLLSLTLPLFSLSLPLFPLVVKVGVPLSFAKQDGCSSSPAGVHAKAGAVPPPCTIVPTFPPPPPHTQSVAIVRYVNNSDNLLRVEAPNGLKHDSRWKMNQRVSNLVSFRVVAMLTPSSSIHLVSTPSSLMSRAGSGRLHRARPTPHHLLSSPPLNSRRRPG